MPSAAEPQSGHCAHHEGAPASAHAHHHHGAPGAGPLRLAVQATLHCLTGCVIGEVIGLMIGVSLGLAAWQTILLATTLAYATGMTLGLLPVMKGRGIGALAALKIIWVGEIVSIGVMEIAMNAVDYSMGGMSAPSIFHWTFWQGFLVAVPAGFLAALPVNHWLLKRNLKNCH